MTVLNDRLWSGSNKNWTVIMYLRTGSVGLHMQYLFLAIYYSKSTDKKFNNKIVLEELFKNAFTFKKLVVLRKVSFEIDA